MSSNTAKTQSRSRATIATTVVVFLLILAGLVWMAREPVELTRIRNSFLVEAPGDSSVAWSGPEAPADFLLEHSPPPKEFQNVIREVLDRERLGNGAFEDALTIARHLATGLGGRGGAIQSTTVDAYTQILEHRRGYCADFTQVFNGLAISSGISVREWGMSFGGFNGTGHAFNEVYDAEREKWIFIDSHKSFYVRDVMNGQPLSAMEFRERLLAVDGDTTFQIEYIDPEHFGFRSLDKALAFYHRGQDQFFLWYGNNVFSYDNHPIVKFFGFVSRPLEQLAAIAIGIHPRIRIIESDSNIGLIRELHNTRRLFLSGAVTLVLLGLILGWQVHNYRAACKRGRTSV